MTYQSILPVVEARTLVGAAVDRVRRISEQLDYLLETRHREVQTLSQAWGGHARRVEAPGSWVDDLVLVPAGVRGPNGAELISLVEPVDPSPVDRGWAADFAQELRILLRTAEQDPVRRRSFGRTETSAEWAQAASRLLELDHWLASSGTGSEILSAQRPDAGRFGADALGRALNVAAPQAWPVLAAPDVLTLGQGLTGGNDLIGARDALVGKILTSCIQLQGRMLRRRLSQLDLEALRQVSRGEIRIGPLTNAGLETVQDVLESVDSLTSIAGVSSDGARHVAATALAIRKEMQSEIGSRVDLSQGDDLATEILQGLRSLLGFEETLDTYGDQLQMLVDSLGPLEPFLGKAEDTVLLHGTTPRRAADLARYVRERVEWLRTSGVEQLLAGKRSQARVDVSIWTDYASRAATYHGLLAQLLNHDADSDQMQGRLPTEVVEAVQRVRLDVSALRPNLRSSLRGYQKFGASYAIAQQRVLLGDEMGLGKTVQALAVMSHLHGKGASHFLVVCPPAVLVNWIKEVRRHSTLSTFRLHGVDKESSLRRWARDGGVAVTTYGTLGNLDVKITPELLVVDEAHFVKNPERKRSRAVMAIAENSERVMFMSGTPLENHVEEFTNLVGMLQPEIVTGLKPEQMVVGARSFREAVAPVYLRRNARDVLAELGDLVQVEEWTEYSAIESSAYLDAVAAGDFAEMRRVAWTADPTGSEKLNRLEELVEEAAGNGLKVLVFSFYLDIVRAVAERLGNRVDGVITGAVSADDRERMVTSFTDADRPGVLIGQISAAGTGLNIQAASVVIICEPQVKPSLESQAIARAHRMGQLRTVRVHRLLTTESIDERMMDILGTKSAVFDQFVARSEVADSTPEATDVSETQLVRQVLNAEQERLAAQIRERRANQPSPENFESRELGVQVQQSSAEVEAPSGGSETEEAQVSSASRKRESGARSFEAYRQSDVCGSCDTPIDVLGHCGCS